MFVSVAGHDGHYDDKQGFMCNKVLLISLTGIYLQYIIYRIKEKNVLIDDSSILFDDNFERGMWGHSVCHTIAKGTFITLSLV